MNSRKLIITLVLLCTGCGLHAEDHGKAKVMLFGVFHFANPGLDKVKTDQLNVMTDANQSYLEQLAQRIAEFRPTVVLLEYGPANQAKVQALYETYRAGSRKLKSNEIYQLGFRIAGLANLQSVHTFDERTIGWNAEPMFEYMKTSDTQAEAEINKLYADMTRETELAHKTLSLKELLLQSNDPLQDQLNKSSYILTNDVGAGVNYVGADAAASWWHRNFRMYANIQQAAQPGERVLVIGGQGHIAILRDLLALDEARKAVDVIHYL
jgi:hypothetical protein